MASFVPTASTHRVGARTLPREAYTFSGVLEAERERIFARSWNCVGRSSALYEPGAYFLAEVAGESLIVVQDDAGTSRAFFNVCRHRGTRLCMEEAGSLTGPIRCPYHGWSYKTSGELIAAPHMREDQGFRFEEHGLHEAAVAEWDGFLFVNIARDPVPFEEAWAPMRDRLSRFGLADLDGVHSVEYEVAANWKLVFQNYSECLHCPMIHPELSFLMPYQSGANDLTDGPFLGGFMEIRPPHESATTDGRRCAPLVSELLDEEERRRAYYYTLMPNMMLSIHPDYVNYYIVRPLAVDRTLVTSEWLFRGPDPRDRSFEPERAVGFWETTNQQDWAIVERSQLGIASARYTPGPYSARESMPAAWDREYLRQMDA